MQAPIFREHFDRLPTEDRHRVLSYLGACIDRYSLEQLVNLVTIQAKEQEALMRSIAQGYQEAAWQEGRQTKAVEIARNMLGKGYSSEVVTELTGLAREALNKLQANS